MSAASCSVLHDRASDYSNTTRRLLHVMYKYGLKLGWDVDGSRLFLTSVSPRDLRLKEGMCIRIIAYLHSMELCSCF